ncbi:Unknown protein sequence [Pseudomonas coronafaciens pv. oryzae]|nr:Unknown protein sequence [Pseudomonas coronafaciens pv. oryzae]
MRGTWRNRGHDKASLCLFFDRACDSCAGCCGVACRSDCPEQLCR